MRGIGYNRALVGFMPIVSILVFLIVIGVILYMVNTYIPMTAPIKMVINVIVVLALCIFLLNMFGFMDYTIPVHRR